MKNILMIIIVLVLLIGFIYENYKNCTEIKLNKYVIKNNKIPNNFDGYKILQISDLHNGQLGKDNENLINEVKEYNPDIIVLTGDIVDARHTKKEVVYSFIEKLNNQYPIYYVFGNHEISLNKEELAEYIEKMKNLNIHILINGQEIIEKDDQHINIYGLNLTRKMYRKEEEVSTNILYDLIPVRNTDEFNILLTHNPLEFEKYIGLNMDLILCGHVHGGNIRIPKLGGIFSPDVTLFPKYSKGIYLKDNTQMVVSAGLSAGTLKFRLNNPIEIVGIELKK